MFELTPSPLSIGPMNGADAGGFVQFEGKVRNHADGRAVTHLEYEAYPELAIKEGEALVREAVAAFDLIDAKVIHRTGLLQVGDTAVIIQVASAHRREAFAGCEWIIDQLKHRVPIWKKEHYVDGDSGWVGSDFAIPDVELLNVLSARQRALDEVGEMGQERLRRAKVLLVGVGGLGSGCLPYLAGAGVGTIGVVDADAVDLTNLHRQVLYRVSDQGRSKAERAASFALKLNPTIVVQQFPEPLTQANAEALVNSFDWIVDGTDSLEAKFLLNRVCRQVGKPLVTASVHRFEGQLMTIAPDGPCLRCLFPSPPPEHCVGTCAETGILGVVPGLFGVLQANEVLKGILGYGEVLRDHMVLMDLRTLEITKIGRAKMQGCPVCAGGADEAPSSFELASLDEARTRFGEFLIVDIREFDEGPDLPCLHQRIPLSQIAEVPSHGPVVLICSSGVRSLQAALRLRANGRQEAYSLRGGLAGLLSD